MNSRNWRLIVVVFVVGLILGLLLRGGCSFF